MSDQNEYSGTAENGSSSSALAAGCTKKELSTLAGETVSKIAGVAQQAGTQARETATSLVSEAGENAKRLMNKQVGNGADLIGHVATSVKVAARSLDDNAPQLAKWAQGAATRADDFAASIRYQTVDQLYANASDYARRKPAMAFSIGAACGFLLFRLFKANANAVQPQRQGNSAGAFSGHPPNQDGQF